MNYYNDPLHGRQFINYLDKEIKFYIDYWINKYDPNNKDSDLLYDLKLYIYKKIYK